MKIGLMLGITVGAVGTYAIMGKDMKIDRMIKKFARKVKTKYKEMME